MLPSMHGSVGSYVVPGIDFGNGSIGNYPVHGSLNYSGVGSGGDDSAHSPSTAKELGSPDFALDFL